MAWPEGHRSAKGGTEYKAGKSKPHRKTDEVATPKHNRPLPGGQALLLADFFFVLSGQVWGSDNGIWAEKAAAERERACGRQRVQLSKSVHVSAVAFEIKGKPDLRSPVCPFAPICGRRWSISSIWGCSEISLVS